MKILSTGLQIGQTIKSAARLRQIVSVLGKHGFHNVLERAKLGRFILKRVVKSGEEKLSAAERARLAFEELGPTFVKLGQLLSTRPNLIPLSFVEEFKKFHDQVSPFPFSEIEPILKSELGDINQIFQHINPQPIAAASIAQVHPAILKDGTEVVVKVQRPGIVAMIEDDLGVLYTLANLFETYIPESRPFSPVKLVDEFFKTLELETNFIVEAHSMSKIRENLKDEPDIYIPKIFSEFCTPKVLVMEQLKGFALSDIRTLEKTSIDLEEVVRKGLRIFFRMVFRDGMFHGDLHAGNIFILPDSRIGLIDFGVVGRLTQKTRDSIANMLIALATEDYEALTYEYLELSPYNSKIDFDQFHREIRDLIAPFHGVTFKNINLGKILMDSAAVAAKYNIIMPSELMLFFKALVTAEGMGRTLVKDFDVMSYTLEFAREIAMRQYDPQKVAKDLFRLARDSSALIYSLPRQLRQLLRKFNSKDFAIDFNLKGLEEMKQAMVTNGILNYLAIVISALLLSSTLALNMGKGPTIYDLPVVSLVGFGSAFFLALVAFYNYLK